MRFRFGLVLESCLAQCRRKYDTARNTHCALHTHTRPNTTIYDIAVVNTLSSFYFSLSACFCSSCFVRWIQFVSVGFYIMHISYFAPTARTFRLVLTETRHLMIWYERRSTIHGEHARKKSWKREAGGNKQTNWIQWIYMIRNEQVFLSPFRTAYKSLCTRFFCALDVFPLHFISHVSIRICFGWVFARLWSFCSRIIF